MPPRKNLSDLLNSERELLEQSWNTAETPKPIPPGDYICRIIDGQFFNSNKGTPGFKLTLEIIQGEQTGRRVWHDIWLSAAAMPMAKRDLGMLGITQLEQLDQTLPEGFIVEIRLVLRQTDEGTEFSRVNRFNVIRFDPPTSEPFPPDDDPNGSDPSQGHQSAKAKQEETAGQLF